MCSSEEYLSGCSGFSSGNCLTCASNTCTSTTYLSGCGNGNAGTCISCATCANGTPDATHQCSGASGVAEKCSDCSPGYELSDDVCVASTPEITFDGTQLSANVPVDVDQAASGNCVFTAQSSPHPHLKSTCAFEQIYSSDSS